MKPCEYPYWLDCVWLASDRNGHVAAFTTGGEGPIPISVLNGETPSFKDAGAAVDRLPLVSEARLLVSMTRPDDYIEWAGRGLFTYDWQDVERVRVEESHLYEPIAVPSEPITLDALPDLLRKYVMKVSLGSIAFSEGEALDVTGLVDCCRYEHR